MISLWPMTRANDFLRGDNAVPCRSPLYARAIRIMHTSGHFETSVTDLWFAVLLHVKHNIVLWGVTLLASSLIFCWISTELSERHGILISTWKAELVETCLFAWHAVHIVEVSVLPKKLSWASFDPASPRASTNLSSPSTKSSFELSTNIL